MKIVSIDRNSPLYGLVGPGADLLSVNGHAVADELDFHFHNTEETLRLVINVRGREQTLELDEFTCGDLGLEFEKLRIRVCNNNCLFCFVHQQPRGMRRSLYIKDDDYRFSFTHGNFISLSRMTEADYRRIVAQRLSPMYISVHATDDTLRRCIFQNEKLDAILPRLRYLTGHGITLHTQTVICPGLNDGEHLEKTIRDLAALAPGVASLAVVPVGLTRYRRRLPKLRGYTPDEAASLIRLVETYQKKYLSTMDTRFVYPADEFFLLSGRALPPLSYYEDMPQFENGVGMARQFIIDFNRRKRFLPRRIDKPMRLEIISGRSAEPFMDAVVMAHLRGIKGLQPILTVVDNRFWGETVTVTGLLTGADILGRAKETGADITLLPPNCLNFDDLFLDDMSLDEFSRSLGRPVVSGSYNIVEEIKQAIAMRVN